MGLFAERINAFQERRVQRTERRKARKITLEPTRKKRKKEFKKSLKSLKSFGLKAERGVKKALKLKVKRSKIPEYLKVSTKTIKV